MPRVSSGWKSTTRCSIHVPRGRRPWAAPAGSAPAARSRLPAIRRAIDRRGLSTGGSGRCSTTSNSHQRLGLSATRGLPSPYLCGGTSGQRLGQYVAATACGRLGAMDRQLRCRRAPQGHDRNSTGAPASHSPALRHRPRPRAAAKASQPRRCRRPQKDSAGAPPWRSAPASPPQRPIAVAGMATWEPVERSRPASCSL